MEEAREMLRQGVLAHLEVLEEKSVKLSQYQQQTLQKQSRVKKLRDTVQRLRAQRDQLRAKVNSTMSLQMLTAVLNLEGQDSNEEDDEETQYSIPEVNMSLLKARQTQVKSFLDIHRLIGGYDITETRSGRGLCFSLSTAYEGLYLDSYNLEIDLTRTLRIYRHNIPPFIPLEQLAKQNLQTDILGFLSSLSQHLNGFAGRSYQVKQIQEQLGDTVAVLEKNSLCNLVTIMCSDKVGKETSVLIILEYGDLTRCLPTQVTIESEDKALSHTARWIEYQSLFMQTPGHKVLLNLKKKGRIL
uniref:Centromere protein O n=1 Tax=Lepisosteus oculatus TaxID=7918 RepID=W5NG07_LEPOC|nr:PREDICTED: centromere protein O [Lepisosteus oculatus]